MRQKPFFLLVLLAGSCATPIEQGAGTLSAGGARPASAGSPSSAGSIASGGATDSAGATSNPLGAGGSPAGSGGAATDSGGAAGTDPGGASGDSAGAGTSGASGQNSPGGSAGSTTGTAGSGTAGGAGKAGSTGVSGTGNAGSAGVSGAGGTGNGGSAGVGGVAGAGNGGAANGGTAGGGGASGAAGAAGSGGAGGGACVLGTAFTAQFWTAAAPSALPSGTFRITNNSGVDVSYGAIEVRYYLTNEETAALTPIFVTFNHFRPAGFSAGTIGNVRGSYLPLTPAAPGANTYLSIMVLGGEGSFVAGENSIIGFYSSLAPGVSKTNQTGDYSYDGHATADPGPLGALSSKVTLYVNGTLAWGCEP